MSFSQTDLTTALKTLSDRLPQFSEQQTRAGRMLRVVTERLSSHLNDTHLSVCVVLKLVVIAVQVVRDDMYYW